MVPVAVSTALSTKDSVPSLACPPPTGSARTAALPEPYALAHKILQLTMAWQVVQGLNARISQLRAMTVSQPGRAADAGAEMERIIGAIAARDGDAAAQASFDHLDRVKRLAAAALKAR